ncbi:MAG: indole-3-glycerol-phosphate synthase TrpC, partial [Eubacteriaceae bacterium]|nr:indole-3-glycerol-phosphate synthase TrpC [Eubacteriaceae bacterium]
MADILNTIADHARKRVEAAKMNLPITVLAAQVQALPPLEGFPFEAALSREDMAFICECKQASPSKGLIAPDFP